MTYWDALGIILISFLLLTFFVWYVKTAFSMFASWGSIREWIEFEESWQVFVLLNMLGFLFIVAWFLMKTYNYFYP